MGTDPAKVSPSVHPTAGCWLISLIRYCGGQVRRGSSVSGWAAASGTQE